jgi:hypothetical protein
MNPDSSFLLSHYSGSSYFISSEFKGGYIHYWYEPSIYNDSTLTESFDENNQQTKWSDSSCTYYKDTALDYSQADTLGVYCKNGSFLYYPAAWTNISEVYS